MISIAVLVLIAVAVCIYVCRKNKVSTANLVVITAVIVLAVKVVGYFTLEALGNLIVPRVSTTVFSCQAVRLVDIPELRESESPILTAGSVEDNNLQFRFYCLDAKSNDIQFIEVSPITTPIINAGDVYWYAKRQPTCEWKQTYDWLKWFVFCENGEIDDFLIIPEDVVIYP